MSRRPSRDSGNVAAQHDTRRPPAPHRGAPEVVDPGWLVRALVIVGGAAIVLGYLSICLLVYLGGWQMLLHPARAVERTPASVGIAFEPVRFDAGPTGTPRLTGWWIPGATPNNLSTGPSPASRPTILFLHDGTGSLANALSLLGELHETGTDLFAFDPRGFGASGGPHPSQARMNEDAEAALEYLRSTRGRDAHTIVPFGNGLGAALAVSLVHTHPELPAVIVDNPDPAAADRVADGGQMRFIPVRLLLRDRFELAPALVTLPQPKLLITGGPGLGSEDHTPDAVALFRRTAFPKIAVTLARDDRANFRKAVRRFLDEALKPATGNP